MHFTNLFNSEFKRALDDNFSSIVTENVGPFLYSVVKTIRPKTVLEVGAGYTSVFLAKALSEIRAEDNFDQVLLDSVTELQPLWYNGQTNMRAWEEVRVKGSVPKEWMRRLFMLYPYYVRDEESRLLIIDNLSKELYDNASPVNKALNDLNLDEFVEIINCDVYKFDDVDKFLKEYPVLDFVFLDFGAMLKLPTFFNFFLERLNDFGGCIMIHSTLSNVMHRLWLAELKLKYQNDHTVEIFSFLEPNKVIQNSFTLVKKYKESIGGDYSPPILTQLP